MSLERLRDIENSLLQKIWMLNIENDMYERYLARHDPQIVTTINTMMERAKYARRLTQRATPNFSQSMLTIQDAQLGRQSPSVVSLRSLMRDRTSSLITTGTQDETTKITVAHRMTMVTTELEELQKQLQQYRNMVRRKIRNLRGEIEEAEIRINEACEAKEEFEEEVVKKGVDDITGKIPAERVIRFVEEWLKSASKIIERLRLKTATVKTQIRNSGRLLAQRRELGETLRSVDFDKLSIENQDFAKILEEKSSHVVDMKRIAGRYHLKLTQQKQKLNDLWAMLNQLKRETLLKREQIKESDNERLIVETRAKRMSKELNDLMKLMDDYIAPDILDFVELCDEYVDLQRSYKRLQRRKNIDKVIYEQQKKHLPRKLPGSSNKAEE